MRVKTCTIGEVDKVELTDNGVLTYFKGFKYPIHGFLSEEELWAAEMVKKYVSSWVHMLVSSPQRYLLILLVPFYQRIADQWLFHFSRYIEGVAEHYFKEEELSPAVKEFYRVCMKLWGQSRRNELIIKGLCVFLEKDRGYRYRFQDAMMILRRGMLMAYPEEELNRLVRMYLHREHRPEYKSLELLKYVLKFTDLPNMAREFATEADFNKLALDKSDFWHCLVVESYDYGGMSLDQRLWLQARL